MTSEEVFAQLDGCFLRGPVPAGGIATWFRHRLRTLKDGQDASVPCGDCSICCTRGYEAFVGEDEKEGLLTTANAKHGGLMLQRREDLSCIHLVDGRCSVYERRPRACRHYDCREMLFTQALPANEALLRAIKRWRLSPFTWDDKVVFLALRLASQDIFGKDTAGITCETLASATVRYAKHKLGDAERMLRGPRGQTLAHEITNPPAHPVGRDMTPRGPQVAMPGPEFPC